ncbi:MAG: hypothetical protein QOF29_4151, partial [bacterium]
MPHAYPDARSRTPCPAHVDWRRGDAGYRDGTMPCRTTEDGATSTSRAPRRPGASPAARALAAAGGLLTGAVLAAIAAVRRAKAVHPHGAGYAA